ncbi:high-affinity branched-chain amino acid ABC transporter permease LivM [soil metagenome]
MSIPETSGALDSRPEGAQILQEHSADAARGELAVTPSQQPLVLRALKEAVFAAIVAAGMFLPLIGLETLQDVDNRLIVATRWPLFAAVIALVAAACFLMVAVLSPWLKARRERPRLAATTVQEERKQRLAKLFVPVAIIALVLYPPVILQLTGIQGSIKWVDNFGVQILIYVMLAWGLNVVVGFAGLLDLGYVAFYALGAYSYTLLSVHLGLSFWLLLPLAGLLAAGWGVVLGFPVLRLRGDYLAIVTLAFGEIIRLVLINWRDVTKGGFGISSIPKITLFGIPFDSSPGGFAATFGLPLSSAYYKIFLYYLILALALVTAVATSRLRRLPIGRAWEGLREDEIACRSLGINTTNTKLTAFAIGAGFGGFAGSFFAARQGFISPESFTFLESALIVAIVVLGGMGSMIGVAVAAAVMIGGIEIMRQLDFLKAIFGPNFNPDQYRMLIFGLAMVGVILLRPRGFAGTRTPTVFLFKRKAISSSMVKEGHG